MKGGSVISDTEIIDSNAQNAYSISLDEGSSLLDKNKKDDKKDGNEDNNDKQNGDESTETNTNKKSKGCCSWQCYGIKDKK